MQVSQPTPSPAMTEATPVEGGMPTVYLTSYQDTPVFEAMVRNVAIMMRRADLWLNATQILKVAGMPKTQRTKYLEKEIITGRHEKVQGGYGKFQGTWVPFEVGIDLAHRNHVAEILVPIFQLQAQAAGMSSLPPGVVNAPASASKRKLAGGKGKATAVDTASVGSGRAGTAESSRMSGSHANSPFTSMPFQPAPKSASKAKPNLDTSMRHVQPPSQGSQSHHLSHSQQMQSPGNVFVVQTPQGLQGRTLQSTVTGLIPGYGHSHVPQLYQSHGQPPVQQHQTQTGMQSPMGLYTHHQSQYPHYQQQQPHQTLVIPPPAGHQQNGQTLTLKRPYPEESDFIPGHPDAASRASADLKHGGTVYVDQYGRPFRYQAESEATASAEFATYTTEQGHSEEPPLKRMKMEEPQVQDIMAAMADEPAPMTLAEVSALLNHDNAEGPMESLAEIADADVENGEDYEIENGEVHDDLPPGTRLASKPQRPSTTRDTTGSTPLKDKQQSTLRARAKLLGIFEASGGNDVDLDSLLVHSPRSSPVQGNGDTSLETITARNEIDIDQVIDERGHTALHWAASLAREKLVAQLISRGADVNRGNFAGETPLMRSVLATNNAESAPSFQALLSHHLGESLRTIDNSYRTVLHHIAAVAGIKGRSASANTYLSALLAWMATIESPDQIREYVNIQDVNGDTALNVAARVGNRNIVKLLLDAGADKTKANKLGLRPGDFGVQVEGLDGCPPLAPRARSSHSTSLPPEKAQDLTTRLTSMIQVLNNQFTDEVSTKQDRLDLVQAQVIEATRELATLRRQLAEENTKSAQLDSVEHKRQNLERALKAELANVWSETADNANSADGVLLEEEIDPSANDLSDMEEEERIVQLRRIRAFQKQMDEKLQGKLARAHDVETKKLEEYKKAMATRLKVPVEAIDEGMLDQLSKAVENDGLNIDLPNLTTASA